MVNSVYNGKILSYEDVILEENVFIKSTYKTLPVSVDQAVNDFDKTIILLRKNITEQIESSIITHNERSFLDTSCRKYFLEDISEDEYEHTLDRFKFLNDMFNEQSKRHNIPIFYYEDLYYGDFTPLFNELDIEYKVDDFNEFLNISKRYRIGTLEPKKNKTII
jgi:hypothetical protein